MTLPPLRRGLRPSVSHALLRLSSLPPAARLLPRRTFWATYRARYLSKARKRYEAKLKVLDMGVTCTKTWRTKPIGTRVFDKLRQSRGCHDAREWPSKSIHDQ